MQLVRLRDDAHLPPSWVSRLETGHHKLDVYSLQAWRRILACVETLRENSNALYNLRVACRLLTVLGPVALRRHIRGLEVSGCLLKAEGAIRGKQCGLDTNSQPPSDPGTPGSGGKAPVPAV